MPVNLTAPDPRSLNPVRGVMLGVAAASIRKPGRSDLLVMRIDPGASVAGVFTRNRLAAAPVVLCREHLAALDGRNSVRALVVNTGNANAGTGADGIAAARAVCRALAQRLDCTETQVLPFSTGVIMEPLPVERIVAGLPACIGDLRGDNWFAAAQAIMTTDTLPKAASTRVRLARGEVSVTGIAKGAGMIHPDMATMLGFVATDAAVPREALLQMARAAADRSFHRITVDGDTSTNDSFMLVASGASGIAAETDADLRELGAAVTRIAVALAQAIVRDGEGATKFVTVQVEGGTSEAECSRIAFAIAHSPLVKTAFFASDPNLGRILAAIGYAGVDDLDMGKVDLRLDDVLVARGGGRSPDYREADGRRVMGQSEFTVRVALHRGAASATVWTCDLSHDYVTINAEYRT